MNKHPIIKPIDVLNSFILNRANIKVSNKKLTGLQVRIGHLDTGVLLSINDLSKTIEDFMVTDNLGGIKTNPLMEDEVGHGTHIASIIVGTTRERMQIGIAPNSRLLVGKVMEGGLSVVRILKGLDWLSKKNVPIALLCAGLPNTNPIFGPMMESLKKQGMLVICPIGNCGNGKFLQPGDDASVLSVGAIDEDGDVPRFSGSRKGSLSTQVFAPDILAPGVDVPCATRTGGRANYSGTSMAAAVVAGTAALLLEAEPNATRDQLYDALCYGSTPLNEAQKKHARCGVLNGKLALDYLRENKNRKTQNLPKRPAIVNKGWKDTRLVYELEKSENKDEITAVYCILEKTDIEVWSDTAKELISPYLKAKGLKSITYLKIGKVIIVVGTKDLHISLLNNIPFTYASAADAGLILKSKNK